MWRSAKRSEHQRIVEGWKREAWEDNLDKRKGRGVWGERMRGEWGKSKGQEMNRGEMKARYEGKAREGKVFQGNPEDLIFKIIFIFF